MVESVVFGVLQGLFTVGSKSPKVATIHEALDPKL